MTPRSQEDMVGTERVTAATGRTRQEWFALLDEAGATGWEHPRIAAWLVDVHGVNGWWAQGITVGYEQEHGMRVPGGRRDGTFEASASKTIHRTAAEVFPHLAEEDLRSDWLDGDWRLIGITEPRSVRLHADDGSRVTLMLTPVAESKVRVSVQHAKLASAAAVAETKSFWRSALSALAGSFAGP